MTESGITDVQLSMFLTASQHYLTPNVTVADVDTDSNDYNDGTVISKTLSPLLTLGSFRTQQNLTGSALVFARTQWSEPCACCVR